VESLRQNLVVVCHQIRLPENLGAVARLLANFGFAKLVVSDPGPFALTDAGKTAVKGERILEGQRMTATLPEALAGCVYAVGSTSRSNLRGRRVLTPEEAAQRLAQEAARGQVAWVLGGEKRGLSDEELAECQDVTCIDTDEAQPSMNVSHAASVLLYLTARAMAGAKTLQAPPEPAAALALMQVLEEEMDGALSASGFLNPQAPQRIRKELVHLLERGRPSQREAELWIGAFRQLRRASRPPGT
jgi:tRNA/rRNA methyltransferase